VLQRLCENRKKHGIVFRIIFFFLCRRGRTLGSVLSIVEREQVTIHQLQEERQL